mmetsp:Transcript_26562/g.74250  ORF Transcript_26562/g.74250 Transcript_26562/m.74250 type:complete len:208 (-) Transcript_26562:1424-2047(-)
MPEPLAAPPRLGQRPRDGNSVAGAMAMQVSRRASSWRMCRSRRMSLARNSSASVSEPCPCALMATENELTSSVNQAMPWNRQMQAVSFCWPVKWAKLSPTNHSSGMRCTGHPSSASMPPKVPLSFHSSAAISRSWGPKRTRMRGSPPGIATSGYTRTITGAFSRSMLYQGLPFSPPGAPNVPGSKSSMNVDSKSPLTAVMIRSRSGL